MASEHIAASMPREGLQLARDRIDRLLEDDPLIGTVPHLPDDTLELVTCCMNAIADVTQRRRTLDNEQPTERVEIVGQCEY